MKWYGWLFVGLLVTCLIGLYFYDLSTIKGLKNDISNIKTSSDTIFVKGTIDTVTIKKVYRDTVMVAIKENIDTTVYIKEHEVRLKAIDSLLLVDISCFKPETIITKTDTIHTINTVYTTIEVPAADSFDFADYGYGALSGVIVVLIALLIGG